MKLLPIGISDYKQLVEGNYYYIDKTLFIKELLERGALVTLIPRPRRFGKTLNLSMLRYFFEKSEEDNTHLFEHTQIWQVEKRTAHFGQYPVVFLSFRNIKDSNWNSAYEKIIELISKEFKRFYPIIKSSISELDLNDYIEIMEKKASPTLYSSSLFFLSKLTTEHYKKNTIILLDEYDAPITAAYTHNYYDEALNFYRSFLSEAFKDNNNLKYGVITGILRATKEGIFSGLNNLDVCSLISAKFQDKFGFTDNEVKLLLKDQKLSDKMEEVTQWYDGYKCIDTKLYNPWSIIQCVDNRGLIKKYWSNTSDNALIKKLLILASEELKSELELLLSNQSITKSVDEGIIIPGIEKNDTAIWNLLLFTGYLTYSTLEWIEGQAVCSLKIPNKEIRILYTELIEEIFERSLTNIKTKQLLQALSAGKNKTFQIILQEFIINSMSYFDIPNNEPEKSYHLFILGLLVHFSDIYEVKSNRESGYGRYDIMLIPRKPHIPGIIMEFKKTDTLEEETLETAAQNALDQIKSKDYAAELKDRGVRKIQFLGIAFEGKKVLVKAEDL